jgi:hypothetical protein
MTDPIESLLVRMIERLQIESLASKLWDMCVEGQDGWGAIPHERFDLKSLYHPDQQRFLQAMPTMATGTLRWKGLPSPLLLALPAAPVSCWRMFAVCKPFDERVSRDRHLDRKSFKTSRGLICVD